MIHKFYRAGFYIVTDSGSGAVHIVDETAYDLLDEVTAANLKEHTAPDFSQALLNKYNKQDLLATFDELCKLYDQEILYSDDSYSEFKNATGLAPIKALCLNVAHDCNLRCSYCFASTGSFCGTRKMMTVETGKKAIDMLVKLSEKRHNLEVDFFGGEPLMNFNMVKETVAYARSIEEKYNKKFRFTMTTNGMLLNKETSDYLNKEMSNVVLSIDGRKEVNDRHRVRVDGSGSYDKIVPEYQYLVGKRGLGEYYVRGTYTKYNLDFDKDVLHLYDLGFDQISVEPVVGPEDDDYAIREKDLAEIENSYNRLMETMVERRNTKKGDFNFYHFMVDLDQGPCAIKRLRGCGCGNEYMAITPDGDIYPCHQYVGKDDFILGNVEDGITRPDLKEEFARANIYNKPTCEHCWAKFYCSGGCNANNFNFNGTMFEPHAFSCELMKLRLECAIAVKAATL